MGKTLNLWSAGYVEARIGFSARYSASDNGKKYDVQCISTIQKGDIVLVNEMVYDTTRKGRPIKPKRFISRVDYIYNDPKKGDARTGASLIFHLSCLNCPKDILEYSSIHLPYVSVLAGNLLSNGVWAMKNIPEEYARKKMVHDEFNILRFLDEKDKITEINW